MRLVPEMCFVGRVGNSSGVSLALLQSLLDLALHIIGDGLGAGSHSPHEHLLFSSSEHFLICE